MPHVKSDPCPRWDISPLDIRSSKGHRPLLFHLRR
jgi:hypothetical protein